MNPLGTDSRQKNQVLTAQFLQSHIAERTGTPVTNINIPHKHAPFGEATRMTSPLRIPDYTEFIPANPSPYELPRSITIPPPIQQHGSKTYLNSIYKIYPSYYSNLIPAVSSKQNVIHPYKYAGPIKPVNDIIPVHSLNDFGMVLPPGVTHVPEQERGILNRLYDAAAYGAAPLGALGAYYGYKRLTTQPFNPATPDVMAFKTRMGNRVENVEDNLYNLKRAHPGTERYDTIMSNLGELGVYLPDHPTRADISSASQRNTELLNTITYPSHISELEKLYEGSKKTGAGMRRGHRIYRKPY